MNDLQNLETGLLENMIRAHAAGAGRILNNKDFTYCNKTIALL